MRRALLALLLTTGLVASGCLQEPTPATTDRSQAKSVRGVAPSWDLEALNDTVSQIRFAVVDLLKEDFYHTSTDGVQLHSRIYRHKDLGDWKAPIILHMSPYFGPNGAATSPVPARGLDGWLISHFVPRGYAVVLNDVRGTGESGGCLEQTGPKQTRDSYKVIEDLAAQPWSNGNVGMIGISYDGETQQSAATAQPPSLKTIVPLASVAGQYEWNFYDGVPYTTNGVAGMVGYAAIGVTPYSVPPTSGTKPTNLAERFECHPENLKEGADSRGDFNQYWKDREIRLNVHKIVNTSVLYVHGLEDWNVKPNHIRDWYNDIPAPKHAWLGQWQHNFPDANSFNREWSRTDWKLTVHRWFDYWLLDIDTGIMDEPPVQVMDSTGAWRFEDAWPPASTPFELRLGADNKLGSTQAGELTYEDRGVSMQNSRLGDSEIFISDPLKEDLHYAGWPTLTFHARLNMQGTHFAVHLIDVASDGSEKVINRGYLDAQHRQGLERSVPVPVDRVLEYKIRFFPQDDVIGQGHRIKLRIGAMDDWIQPDGTMATTKIVIDDERPASLTLPVLENSERRFFTPLKIST